MNPDTFSLAATTNDLTRARSIGDVADSIEFRMDKSNEPLEQLEAYDGSIPIIATNRAEWEGGEATDEGRLEDLETAARHDAVEIVDIELEAVRNDERILEPFRELDVELLVSSHDFESTPDGETLEELITECGEVGDIAKVATFANDRADSLTMLGAISAATDEGIPTVGIAMGVIGSHTRVVGPLYGSVISYAPLGSDTTEYAPGQIPLERLRELIDEFRDPQY